MCWCTPEIRTPCCGKPGCHPPQKTILEQISDALLRRDAALDAVEDANKELLDARDALSLLQQRDAARRMRPA